MMVGMYLLSMSYNPESSLSSVSVDGASNGHVIGDDYLLGFVQGTLDPAEALLVATQYHIAPEAVSRVKILASCAAASFEQAEPKTMRCSAQAFFEEKCISPCEKKKAKKLKRCAVPQPLQPFVGEDYCAIRWKKLFSGIVKKVLSIKGSNLYACLVKMDKGASAPMHAHKGDAMVLVLCGSFSDRGALYKKGDVVFYSADPEIMHEPKAEEDCICFAVLHSPLKMKSMWQEFLYRLRSPFARSSSCS